MNTHSTNLDVLRATAVSMVAACHLLEVSTTISREITISLGYTGVMIFFIHTALVLMQSMERLEAEDPQRLAWRFYVRRFFRIYPLATFMVCAAVLITAFYPATFHPFVINYRPTTQQLVANLALVQNLTGARDLILVMWSLPPEVQMYAALPLFFLFRKSLPTTLITFWAGWVIMLTFIDGTKAFAMLQYLPMFLPGIIAYRYMKFVKPRIPGWFWPFGIALPVAYLVGFTHGSRTTSWVGCLVFGLLIPHFKAMRSRPAARLAEVMARYSYGIYLVHVPCIFAGFWLARAHSMGVKVALSLLLTGPAAAVLYHAIELPFLAFGAKLAKGLIPKPPLSKATTAAAL